MSWNQIKYAGIGFGSVLLLLLAYGRVTIRARWWTKSHRADVVQVRASVLQAIKEGLDEAGIDMPYDTKVQLFHDQTEENEGDRSQQREGWPAAEEAATRPRWKAEAEEKSKRETGQPNEREAAGSTGE